MIKIEIGKETFLTRRNSNIWDCKMDQFGTAYCPSELKNASIVSSPLPVEIKTVNHTIYDEKVATPYYKNKNFNLQSRTYMTCYNCEGSSGYSNWNTVTSSGITVFGFQVDQGVARYSYSLQLRVVDNTLQSRTYTTCYNCEGSSGYSNWNTVTSSGITVFGFQVDQGVARYSYSLQLRVVDNTLQSRTYTTCYNCEGSSGYSNWNTVTSSGITVFGFQVDQGVARYSYSLELKSNFSCPSGTTQEGNQCKGINYVCPAGYTDNGSNCKKTITYSCNSNLISPILLDGNWKCGSLVCDGNLKCGYGTCDLPSKPSLDKYQDVAYNPLQYITNNQCNGDICDYTINAKVSYCESLQCPKGDDIIQDSGKCYKLECPKGTHISGDKCIKVN